MRLQHEGDGDHGIDQAGAQHRDQHQRQEQRRKGQDDVHDAHDQRIDQAPAVTRQQAEDDAGDERRGHHDETDGQREARTIDQARQDIAADGVGAEQELGVAARLPGRRRQEEITELVVRRMRREQRREDRHQDQQRKDDEADHRALVDGEVMPELGEHLQPGILLLDDGRGFRGGWAFVGHVSSTGYGG